MIYKNININPLSDTFITEQKRIALKADKRIQHKQWLRKIEKICVGLTTCYIILSPWQDLFKLQDTKTLHLVKLWLLCVYILLYFMDHYYNPDKAQFIKTNMEKLEEDIQLSNQLMQADGNQLQIFKGSSKITGSFSMSLGETYSYGLHIDNLKIMRAVNDDPFFDLETRTLYVNE